MTCPKCGNEYSGGRCGICGYDRSADCLRYPTLTPVSASQTASADAEEERLRSLYETALAVEQAASTEAGFSAAALLYEQMGKPGWRDSAQRARRCREMARRLEQAAQPRQETGGAPAPQSGPPPLKAPGVTPDPASRPGPVRTPAPEPIRPQLQPKPVTQPRPGKRRGKKVLLGSLLGVVALAAVALLLWKVILPGRDGGTSSPGGKGSSVSAHTEKPDPTEAMTPTPVKTEPDEDSSYTYKLDGDGNAAITGYTGSKTALAISASLEGHPVTTIGKGAFSDCSGLTAVTIPDSVTTIELAAFSGCSGLTAVTIPDSVTTIGSGAFMGCSGLTAVTIPESVTSIESGAFEGCSGLTAVTIPKSVTQLSGFAFTKCSGLREIYVASGNPAYCSRDGVLFKKNKDALIRCPEGREGRYTIPPDVKQLFPGAFEGCSLLTGVTIPKSVTLLSSIRVFSGCTLLTSAGPVGSGCSIEFGWEDEIPSFAFCGSPVSTVTIPVSVTEIGPQAFSDCAELKEIRVSDGNTAYCSAEGVLFSKDMTLLVRYPAGKETDSYTVPDGVTALGPYAFQDCVSLTEVLLPASVNALGSNAFDSCTGLTAIAVPEGVTKLPGNAFYECTGLVTVRIPASVTEIGNAAFGICSALTDVYYGGTREQWSAVAKAENNSGLEEAEIHFGG